MRSALRQSASFQDGAADPSACRSNPREVFMKRARDIEKDYPLPDFIDKLRRLADALEKGERFEIQIAGERVYVPVRARFNIEHERGEDGEEIEFQITWDKA